MDSAGDEGSAGGDVSETADCSGAGSVCAEQPVRRPAEMTAKTKRAIENFLMEAP